jgi:hypothetical protein
MAVLLLRDEVVGPTKAQSGGVIVVVVVAVVVELLLLVGTKDLVKESTALKAVTRLIPTSTKDAEKVIGQVWSRPETASTKLPFPSFRWLTASWIASEYS